MKLLTALTISSIFAGSNPAPALHLQRTLNAFLTPAPVVHHVPSTAYILFSA